MTQEQVCSASTAELRQWLTQVEEHSLEAQRIQRELVLRVWRGEPFDQRRLCILV